METTIHLKDLAALGPLLILLAGGLILLLIESFAPVFSKRFSFALTIVTILSAIGSTYIAPDSQNPLLTHWLKFDTLTKIFTLFFLLIGLGSAFLAFAFFARFEATRGEYYFLLISALFGLILIGAAADFLMIFLGIETLALSLYVLCSYMKAWDISRESSFKYFLMGSLAAAFFLYGVALIYGATGTTKLDALMEGYHALTSSQSKALFFAGVALITIGLAFEAAIVPFHVWAPDVYSGAPTPVTAFMSVGTKVGAFAAFIRVFMEALPQFNLLWNEGIALLAYPTLIYANAVAMRQVQLRRFFAYSGISHAGFLLLPLAAETPDSLSALLFYTAIYAIATLGCFAVMAFLDHDDEGVMMHHLNGLFYRSPLLGGIFILCLLTLAGIPPTAGFFAKFFIFKVAFEAGYVLLVITALLTTILAAYYYLRMIGLMLTKHPAEEAAPLFNGAAVFVGMLSFAALLILAFYPIPLFDLLMTK